MNIAITSCEVNGRVVYVVVSCTGAHNYVAQTGYNLIETVQFCLDEYEHNHGSPGYIIVTRSFRFAIVMCHYSARFMIT